MSGFLFGGNTGMSYDQLQRQREIAAALAARGPGAPRNVGEGLSAIGNALAIRGLNKKADAAETTMRSEFDKQWQGLFGGAGQPAPMGMPPRGSGRVETMSEGEAVADDAMATLIKLGLTERGLPEHVADGFVINAADESGFRTDINEANPLVPGSRGGYGLMQWTGPRRVALEQEAARRGVDPSNLQLQLDTIVSELQGPEARAGQSIMSTKDAPSAATAIVNEFLRPAPAYRANRAAEYSSGGGYNIEAIANVLGSPMASPGQRAVAEALLQQELQRMQPPDPMEAIELERAQLELDALRNPQPEQTDDMREYQFARSQGYTGTFQDFMTEMRRAGATNVTTTVNGEGQSPELLGTQGLVAIPAPGTETGWIIQPAPGSPLANEQQAAEEKSAESERQQNRKLDGTLGLINLNISEIENGGLPVTGPIGAARRTWLGQAITGSGAVDVQNRTDAITDGAAFAEIQNMRDNSPTGGAVGQLTDQERRAIGNAVTALNTATSQEEYLRAAKTYRQLALDLAYGEGNWSLNEAGEVVLGGQGEIPSGDGLTAEERRYLGLE